MQIFCALAGFLFQYFIAASQFQIECTQNIILNNILQDKKMKWMVNLLIVLDYEHGIEYIIKYITMIQHGKKSLTFPSDVLVCLGWFQLMPIVLTYYIINSAPFYSQQCPNMDDELYFMVNFFYEIQNLAKLLCIYKMLLEYLIM